jgi:uncharacterized protein (DUF885 family)
MKRVAKYLGGLLALLLLAGAGLVVNVLWFKPFSVDLFFERVFLELALKDPELLSTLRILEPLGLDFHSDDLSDASPEHSRQLLAKSKRDLATLRRYDYESLSENQQMSYDILDYFLQQAANAEPFQFHNYPVNQLFGVQNDLPDFMINIHQVNSVGEAEDYIARLRKVPVKFDQTLEGLALRQEMGIVPPKFVVERVLGEMRNLIAKPATENTLYTTFAEKLDGISMIGEHREPLLADCADALNTAVYPAYEKLIAFMDKQLSIATEDDGVWKLPNGDAYYALALQDQTTTSMTPEEVHQLGLKETARIQAEMDAILQGEGLTEGTVGERVLQLNRDPRFLYTNDDAGREACLEDYRKIIDEVNAGINAVFDLRPAASVAVERIPEFRQDGAPGAYYQMPAMDGSRPGTFYANLRDMSGMAKFGMRTLAYHEAIPGHHFQIAIQQEIKGPTFRKMPLFTAYTEGWALYAEQLAWEQGFQKDPYDNLGRLQGEIFRAVRLVVDTGIHYKRWTRQQAIDYMVANTGMDVSEVTTEIERYIVNPGQACAYKVGMLKILALRERARNALGDKFDLKVFHNHVLANGALPLDVLEKVIDRYIERTQAAA